MMMNFISYWKLDRFRKILGVMKKPEMQETCLVWINDAKISDLHHQQHQQPGLGHLKQVENYMTCLNVILGPHQAGKPWWSRSHPWMEIGKISTNLDLNLEK